MDLFGSPDIDRMAAERDLEGLYQLLEHRDKAIRLQAAQSLAELDDTAGWQFLFDAVRNEKDPDSQIIAADMLGELGQVQAVPALEEALKTAGNEPADAVKNALQLIGGPEADEAFRRAGYEPIIQNVIGAAYTEYDARYVRAVTPDTGEIEFLTAEQHLNLAVELREAEQTERAMVENSLALWLNPEWAYAWYLRGVLYEDMDRFYEASLCYHWALELDDRQEDARSALDDLEAEHTFPALELDLLLTALNDGDWRSRRDAAAGLGELGETAVEAGAVEALIEHLEDEDREVRHAVIEALGNLDQEQAVMALVEHDESTWLMRFAVIEALAEIGSVDGLEEVLRKEMTSLQERNPVFSRYKDPLVEVEYERLMELGVLAFVRAGDINALLSIAEDNGWVDEDEVEEEEAGAPEEDPEAVMEEEYEEEYEDEEEVDLERYVDETAQMVSLALERLALQHMSELPVEIVQRLADVPDLMLIDVAADLDEEESAEEDAEADLAIEEDLVEMEMLEEDGEEEEEEEAEWVEQDPILIHDLSSVREAAASELARRQKE